MLLIPSAVHSHPPSCLNFAQLTQNHDLRMTVLTLGWGAICGPDTTPEYVNEVSPTVAEIRPKCIRYQMGIMFKIAHSPTYCRGACQAIVIYSKPISTVKHRKLHKKLFLCHFSTMAQGISKCAFSYQATWTLIKSIAVFFTFPFWLSSFFYPCMKLGCNRPFPRKYQLNQTSNHRNNIPWPQKHFYTVFCHRLFPPYQKNL